MSSEQKYTVKLPTELWARFDAFCSKKGTVKQQAVGAALELFMAASAELREALIAQNFAQAQNSADDRMRTPISFKDRLNLIVASESASNEAPPGQGPSPSQKGKPPTQRAGKAELKRY